MSNGHDFQGVGLGGACAEMPAPTLGSCSSHLRGFSCPPYPPTPPPPAQAALVTAKEPSGGIPGSSICSWGLASRLPHGEEETAGRGQPSPNPGKLHPLVRKAFPEIFFGLGHCVRCEGSSGDSDHAAVSPSPHQAPALAPAPGGVGEGRHS